MVKISRRKNKGCKLYMSEKVVKEEDQEEDDVMENEGNKRGRDRGKSEAQLTRHYQ